MAGKYQSQANKAPVAPMPYRFQEYPKHVFHPRHDIEDHTQFKVVNNEAEYQALLDKDEGWRDTPYTEEEAAEYIRQQGPPKRSNYKTKKEFDAALAEYREAQEAGDEADAPGDKPPVRKDFKTKKEFEAAMAAYQAAQEADDKDGE